MNRLQLLAVRTKGLAIHELRERFCWWICRLVGFVCPNHAPDLSAGGDHVDVACVFAVEYVFQSSDEVLTGKTTFIAIRSLQAFQVFLCVFSLQESRCCTTSHSVRTFVSRLNPRLPCVPSFMKMIEKAFLATIQRTVSVFLLHAENTNTTFIKGRAYLLFC